MRESDVMPPAEHVGQGLELAREKAGALCALVNSWGLDQPCPPKLRWLLLPTCCAHGQIWETGEDVAIETAEAARGLCTDFITPTCASVG
jgi:hypothetical protein